VTAISSATFVAVRAPAGSGHRGLGLVALLTLLLSLASVLVGCNDLRDFRGTWEGRRVGDDPALLVGTVGTAPGSPTMEPPAVVTIASLDRHGLHGHLSIEGAIDAELDSLPGAEADVLAGMTFDGAPLRVYLAFVALAEGGDATAILSLHEDDRVDLRLLRGGSSPLYAIYSLGRR
jgi:hypothetical protein